ncbi:uncharacterized protein LOC132745106, partial [Ruditapes philippinarum]|uniref:uncharacterized protein LOC132745106 n=1 Tax=Ruditapes philippinarum TaxID=129788 RepID=UPI00295AD270
MSSEVLNETLGYFITEVRTISGKEYKPITLYEIIIAIQHHLRQQGRLINFLDDAAFDGLRRILDAKMKQLSKQGLGMQRRSTAIISEEQENELLNKRILETETPQMLLDTSLYTLGLHFTLRAGQEHRALRVGENGQITVKRALQNRRYLEYHEYISKTNRGGIQHLQEIVKQMPYTCDLLKRPRHYAGTAIHPLAFTCYNRQLVTCANELPSMDITPTRLYEAGIDEQLIIEKKGHRSNAVRSSKRTSEDQLMQVSGI